MVLLVESQAVFAFVLLATASTAMITDETHSSPPAASGPVKSPVPGAPPSEISYRTGGPRNVYTYPMEKQYSTYTYNGGPSSQYGGAAPEGGNADNGYSAPSAYQTGAHVAPRYVSSFRGFPSMAIAKPYTYYIAHPGEASGAYYAGTRDVINEGLHPEADVPSNRDSSQSFTPVKDAQRSLLEMITPQEPLPASSLSSYTSSSFLENARVQISFSGGYPTNSPRYTYLTFIIPGDICTLNQQEVEGSTSLLGSQTITNHQIPYGSSTSSFFAPAGSVSVAGYGTASQYQYGGSAGQNQAVYSNGQTMYEALPGVGQTYGGGFNGGVDGGLVGGGAPGATFFNSMEQRPSAVRSLDDHVQNVEESKPPPSPSASDASANTKPDEASAYAPGARSIQ